MTVPYLLDTMYVIDHCDHPYCPIVMLVYALEKKESIIYI